jgi:hypothetical protein
VEGGGWGLEQGRDLGEGHTELASQTVSRMHRSRSVSEVDVLADDVMYIVEPAVPVVQLELNPPADLTTPTQSMTSSVTCDSSGAVLRRYRATPATTAANRGSFYASGTLSACASRDHSPVGGAVYGQHLLPFPVMVRRICDYPPAPPSMIITPSRTPLRCGVVDYCEKVNKKFYYYFLYKKCF